jgi:hypothetical protein
MVAWWDGDNYSTTKLGDLVLSNDGNPMLGPGKAVGYVCDAMSFSGLGEHFVIPHHDSLSFGNGQVDRPFSIEAWVYLHDLSNGSSILTKGAERSREYSFRFQTSNPGKLAFAVYDDRRPGGTYNVIGKSSTVDFTPDENTWVHVAVTYDGSGVSSGIKLYRNGVHIPDTVTLSDSLGTNYVAIQANNESLCIGKFFYNTSGSYYDGSIDELSVYSKVLSSNEVMGIFSAGSNGKCLPLTYTDTSGCHPLNNTTGIRDIRNNKQPDISFQNPVRNTLKLNTDEIDLSRFSVELMNMKGQLVYTSNSASRTMNLSQLAGDVYLMNLISIADSEKYSYKIIVSKE